MLASILLDECRKAGIDFYTGVPDSFLKGLCDELFARFGTDSPHHIVAHNEGGAIGLCAGHYLATGKPALCYMQNSGLGNSVNPLTSLTDPQVYSVPCLLVIGWRGEPGVKDEPQHIKQGAITLSLLDLLGIPYKVLSPDTSAENFHAAFSCLADTLQYGRPAALVVRKGSLSSNLHPVHVNDASLTREKAAKIILQAAGKDDCFVSTTGKLSREVFEIRETRKEDHSRDFLTVGSMGHSSSIALGIAINKPGQRIWCIDGDGAVLMHMGAMAVIGANRPKNLVHIVINNGAHETVGGMPTVAGELDLVEIAKACGYPKATRVASFEELDQALEDARDYGDLSLIEVLCSIGAREDLGRPTTTALENKKGFMDYLSCL